MNRKIHGVGTAVAEQKRVYHRVLNLLGIVDHLHLRIAETVAVIDIAAEPQRADVDVLVDRESDDGAAVMLEIGGVVGAAAEQTDPERRPAGDDHGCTSLTTPRRVEWPRR